MDSQFSLFGAAPARAQTYAEQMTEALSVEEGRRVMRALEAEINQIQVSLALKPTVGLNSKTGEGRDCPDRAFIIIAASEWRGAVEAARKLDEQKAARLTALIVDGHKMIQAWHELVSGPSRKPGKKVC